MKDILESKKIFEAHTKIDYCYWLIKQINEKISKPILPIDLAIDKATGINPFANDTKDLIKLLKSVIKYKLIIDADSTADKIMLDNLMRLK